MQNGLREMFLGALPSDFALHGAAGIEQVKNEFGIIRGEFAKGESVCFKYAQVKICRPVGPTASKSPGFSFLGATLVPQWLCGERISDTLQFVVVVNQRYQTTN